MQNIKRLATQEGDEHVSKKFKSMTTTSVRLLKTVPQLKSETKVKIMFWNSPHEIFVQPEDGFKDYENMMCRIQTVYNKSPPIKKDEPAISDHVVAKNRKDNFWYRAKITAYNSLLKKYKLEFVDVGNFQITGGEDVHPIAEEFTKLPTKAIELSLDNIISCGDNANLTNHLNRYINPQNTIICEFLRSENGRFFATVQIDDKDLKTSLINDNFVKHLPETINLKKFVGQTMKLQVANITSLLHFYTNINGIQIPCSYYSAKRAKTADGFINFQQNYENKCCVARIMNVTKTNTLIVGLSVMNDFPEPTYYNIPILTDKSAITVHKVVDFNVVWVQLSAYASQFDSFTGEINQFYQSQISPTTLSLLNAKKLYACKSTIDNTWYRGQILSKNTSIVEVQVQFIDFSRTESIPRENIRILDEQFKYVSSPMMKLYLPYQCIDKSQRQMIINEVTTLTNGYDLTLNLIRSYKNVCIGSISHKDVAMDKILIYKQLVEPAEINKIYEEIDAQEQEESDLSTICCNFERCVLGYISHVIDPENFFVQLKSDENLLEELVADLQVSVPTFQRMESVEIGVDCYAFCSEYTCWYRARITEKVGEIITVQYVDYGNTEEVTIDNLKKNSSEPFVPFARLCSLPVSSKEENHWNPDAVSLLKALVGEEIYFETLFSQEDRTYINLGSKTENLTKFLIDNNFADSIDPNNAFEISVKTIQAAVKKMGCGMVQVVLFLSLKEFFLQFKDSLSALDIMGELLAQTELVKLENPEIGDVVAARFADDNLLYRAKIIGSSQGDGRMVYFLDYGNTTLATEFRTLPEKLMNIAPFVWPCSFERIDDLDIKILEDHLFDENAFFQVQVLRTLETGQRIVRLLENGLDILDSFTACQKAPESEDKKDTEQFEVL